MQVGVCEEEGKDNKGTGDRNSLELPVHNSSKCPKIEIIT